MRLQDSERFPDIISHRGNLEGSNKSKENHPDYLFAALKKGFGIEFDVWYVDGEWALGHDEPQYSIPFHLLFNFSRVDSGLFIRKQPKAWIHLKNLAAVQEMHKINEYGQTEITDNFDGRRLADRLNFFWHQEDDITLTNHGHIWAHPKTKVIPVGSGWVVPEVKEKTNFVKYNFTDPNWTRARWVCVDYPLNVKEMFSSLQTSKEYFSK